jgi:hypothetical protein
MSKTLSLLCLLHGLLFLQRADISDFFSTSVLQSIRLSKSGALTSLKNLGDTASASVLVDSVTHLTTLPLDNAAVFEGRCAPDDNRG